MNEENTYLINKIICDIVFQVVHYFGWVSNPSQKCDKGEGFIIYSVKPLAHSETVSQSVIYR